MPSNAWTLVSNRSSTSVTSSPWVYDKSFLATAAPSEVSLRASSSEQINSTIFWMRYAKVILYCSVLLLVSYDRKEI